MGCIYSYQLSKKKLKKNESVEYNDFSTSGDETFTPKQKQTLRDTWKYFADKKQATGMQIFLHIFEECPRSKALFPFKDLEGEYLLRNAMFRCHSLRFMNAVESTIQSIDALDVALIPVLHNLGKAHASIVEYLPRYLPVFMTSILKVFENELGSAFTAEVKDTWGQLASFIALKMLEGYHYGLYEKNGHAQTVRSRLSVSEQGRKISQGSDPCSGRDKRNCDLVSVPLEEDCYSNQEEQSLVESVCDSQRDKLSDTSDHQDDHPDANESERLIETRSTEGVATDVA